MDGAPVIIGTHVHDLAMGAGVVTDTSTTGIEVTFRNGIGPRLTFDLSGKSSRNILRTLYLAPPSILPPTGNPVKDAQFSALARAVYDTLKVTV